MMDCIENRKDGKGELYLCMDPKMSFIFCAFPIKVLK